MREGGAEVIQLEGEGPQHRVLLGPARQVPGFLGDGEHVLGVAAPHVVELTAFDDAFVGELTDGLEHRGALVVGTDQVGVREREQSPSSAPQTISAASPDQPPRKTARRASSSCCDSSSRS